MTSPSPWQSAVPLTQDGDPVNAQTANAPINVLAENTAALKVALEGLQSGEKLTLFNAPLAEGVNEGEIVYLNTTNAHFDKALPVYESLETTNGRLLPSEKAIVWGSVVTKSSATLGNIVTSGVATMSNAGLINLFGTATPDFGVYYLDPTQAGKVISDPPATLMIRAVQYIGADQVRIFQPDFEPETHSHRTYTLDTGEWLPAGSFPSEIVPVGATFGYDFTTPGSISQLLGEVLQPSAGEPEWVWDYLDPNDPDEGGISGRHVNDGVILVDGNGIWWFDSPSPAQDVLLTVTVADTHGEALINTVYSETVQALDAIITNGRARINWKEYNLDTGNVGSQVVKGIDFDTHTLLLGQVVESVDVGPGLSRNQTQGDVVINLDEFNENLIESSVYNLNNAVETVDGLRTYTLFPTTRESSMTLRAQLPNMPNDALFDVVIWVQYLGNGPLITGLDLVVSSFATPSGAGVSEVAGFSETMPDVPAGASNVAFYKEAAGVVDATGKNKGTIQYSLTADNPATDIKLLSTGILLRLK